jgi:hypothetical protein
MTILTDAEVQRLAQAELSRLLDPDTGRPPEARTRRMPDGTDGRPWPAIAEAIRRLDAGVIINGAILVGGTWEIDIDVHGRITGHRYVIGSEPTRTQGDPQPDSPEDFDAHPWKQNIDDIAGASSPPEREEK